MIRYFKTSLPLIAAVGCVAFPVQAQTSRRPQGPPPPMQSFIPLPFNPVPELRDVAELQSKVSLEARQMPLSELLTELKKQSGVAFAVADQFPAAKTLLTLRLNQTPLASLMGSLSRIYGVRWNQENGVWMLRASDQDALQVAVARSVGADGYLMPKKQNRRAQEQADLSAEIYDSVEAELWEVPDGVPLSKLPADLQQRLRQSYENDYYQVKKTIDNSQDFTQLAQQKLVLRLGRIVPGTPTLFSREVSLISPGIGPMMARELKFPQLAVYTSDGRFVTNIFPAFRPEIAPTAATVNTIAETTKEGG